MQNSNIAGAWGGRGGSVSAAGRGLAGCGTGAAHGGGSPSTPSASPQRMPACFRAAAPSTRVPRAPQTQHTASPTPPTCRRATRRAPPSALRCPALRCGAAPAAAVAAHAPMLCPAAASQLHAVPAPCRTCPLQFLDDSFVGPGGEPVQRGRRGGRPRVPASSLTTPHRPGQRAIHASGPPCPTCRDDCGLGAGGGAAQSAGWRAGGAGEGRGGAGLAALQQPLLHGSPHISPSQLPHNHRWPISTLLPLPRPRCCCTAPRLWLSATQVGRGGARLGVQAPAPLVSASGTAATPPESATHPRYLPQASAPSWRPHPARRRRRQGACCRWQVMPAC